ncbi:SDR family oxidoreductase [Ilumatobacter coccineus]|uniref:Putative oxidoreductase n=1 Tax=Ilumatobacter coccineus (strain NBRC 103263 / KCTC 29153 / YM16-304) TaxID=1313172 RepID=A0A6C7EB51_ILUCY|nr:putative oxidoreductase [Ilumatobacter coccineus YM16-304]
MNPVMLVTGGSRGIGAATCVMAAEAGYDVAVNFASNASAADDVVASCVAHGVRSIAVQADVSDEAAVIAMFERVTDELGPVGVLVNNAGILHQQMRFDEMTVDRWRDVLDVNVIGAFICAREAARRMSTRHGGAGGAIVNVSSAASYLGSPGEYVDYAASKAAVDTMTIGLGKELADEGVRVNAVRPGVVHTDIHASGGEPNRVERVAPGVPMQRGGQPDEVAATILWLASDAASYVTATTINCSGGR